MTQRHDNGYFSRLRDRVTIILSILFSFVLRGPLFNTTWTVELMRWSMSRFSLSSQPYVPTRTQSRLWVLNTTRSAMHWTWFTLSTIYVLLLLNQSSKWEYINLTGRIPCASLLLQGSHSELSRASLSMSLKPPVNLWIILVFKPKIPKIWSYLNPETRKSLLTIAI